MDRLSKLVVFVSMTTAVVFEAALMRASWSPILPVTIAVLVAFLAVSLRFPGPAAALVLLFTYIFPAIIFVVRGQFEIGYTVLWVAALLGTMLASGVRAGWAVPARWRAPLALWALTVSLVWPVVALREADFSLMTLDLPRLSVTGPPGVPPLLAIIWTLNVALVLGVGILWFDWLYATFDRAEPRFRRVILGALAVSWLATTSVATYQMLFDVTFMNSGRFGFLQRASGLMLDANPFGVVAALGIPAIAAAAFLTSWRGRTATLVAVVVLAFLGMWASGSRTALATGLIGASCVVLAFRPRVLGVQRITGRWVFAGAAIVAALVLAPILLQRSSEVVGPWRRLVESLPGLTLAELWNRNGYGLNAALMIREFPAFGVGVGSFHHLVLDYSRLPAGGGSIPIDNAQNWYRHQLVEFGLVGSVGWMWWVLSFGWFAVTSARSGKGGRATGSVLGMLVALALISTLGMPTQSAALALTFWTLAFWFSQLVAEPSGASSAATKTPTVAWVAVWALVAAAVAGTAYSAQQGLRVPTRAARFGWPYAYGWHAPEKASDGGEFRWAGRHAVTVLDAPKPWLKLTVSVNHQDVAQKPVDARVWRDGQEVLSARLNSSAAVTEYIRIPEGQPRIVLETRVSRVLRPADFGVPDARELGLMVQWDFVDTPARSENPPKE